MIDVTRRSGLLAAFVAAALLAVPGRSIVLAQVTTTTTTLRPCFFDVFIDDLDIKPSKGHGVTQSTSPSCPAPAPNPNRCTDQPMNLTLNESSDCYQMDGSLWPGHSVSEALHHLQLAAHLACVDKCLLYQCKDPKPYCVEKGSRVATVECVTEPGTPFCPTANQGRHTCTGVLTVCKCRCSRTAFFPS